jgi:hypothetical protein
MSEVQPFEHARVEGDGPSSGLGVGGHRLAGKPASPAVVEGFDYVATISIRRSL